MSRVAAEREWLGKMCSALALAESEDAENNYHDAFSNLAPRIKRALPYDKSGKLSEALTKADDLASRGSFEPATKLLEAAGAGATKILSVADKALPATAAKEWKTKEKGARYNDEEKKFGWRAENYTSAVDPEGNSVVTRYDTPADREAAVRKFDGEGQIVNPATGEAMPDGPIGYVVRSDKELAVFDSRGIDYVFGDGTVHRMTRAQANETVHHNGQSGPRLHLLQFLHGKLKQQIVPHHTTPVAGEAISGGGDLHVKEGHIEQISDQSGHYKPDGDMTFQTVKKLHEEGGLVDNRMTDIHGAPVTDEDSRPILESKAEVIERTKRYKELEALINKKQAAGDDPETFEVEMEELEDLKDFFEEHRLDPGGRGLEAHRVAKVRLVGKIGLTPDEFETVKGNVTAITQLVVKKYVAAYGAEHPGFGGADFRKAIKENKNNYELLNLMLGHELDTVLSAEQYLQTEGNETAIRQKQSVLNELKQKKGAVIRDIVREGKLTEVIAELGGDDALKKLKLDPKLMSIQQQHDVLTGVIPHTTLWASCGLPEVRKKPAVAESAYKVVDAEEFEPAFGTAAPAPAASPAPRAAEGGVDLEAYRRATEKAAAAKPSKDAPKEESPEAPVAPRGGKAPAAAGNPYVADISAPGATVGGDASEISSVSEDDPSEDESGEASDDGRVLYKTDLNLDAQKPGA